MKKTPTSESDTSLYLCNVEKTKEMLLLDKAKNSSLYKIGVPADLEKSKLKQNCSINNKTNKKEKKSNFEKKETTLTGSRSLLDKTLPNSQNCTHEQNPALHYIVMSLSQKRKKDRTPY